MYLVSRYEDSELEGDDGEDDEDDEEDDEEEEEEEEKEEEGKFHFIASMVTRPYHKCSIITTRLFDCNSDLINSTAPAAKKRKTGPETSTTADTSADSRVKGTKAAATDPNTYKAEKGVVANDDEEDGEGEDEG